MVAVDDAPRTLVIACGALAREMLAIVEMNELSGLVVECLPASLHNRPKEIPDAVRARIHRARAQAVRPGPDADGHPVEVVRSGPDADGHPVEVVRSGPDADGHDPVEDADRVVGGRAALPGFDEIFVAYADCGTGGLLAAVCAEEGVEMLDGAHCYEFFATSPRFEEIQDAEIGSFYLTDFLVRHFDRMVWQGLGLDRHPELLPLYFGNYTRLVYLAQTDDPRLLAGAEAAAERLGLTMLVERTGYGDLATTMVELTKGPR